MAGIAISAACLAFALRGAWRDAEMASKLRSALEHADYRTLPLMLALLSLFYWLKAWRWQLLLKSVGSFDATRELFPLVMIGAAFNNLLPAQLGVVVRVALFTRRSHAPTLAVVATIVLERILDGLAVLLVMAAALPFAPDLDRSIRTSAIFAATIIGVLFVVLVPLLIRSKSGFMKSAEAGLAVLRDPGRGTSAVAMSLASWLVNALVVHLALWSFNIEVSPFVSCAVAMATALAIAVPSAPGYVGVVQFCFVSILGPLTGNEASALAASVYYHLADYAFATLTGLGCLSMTGLTLQQARQAAAVDETS